MANLANIAATNMEHLCECSEHGYSQSERWGVAEKGSCWVECEGHTSEFYKGDRDCSSAVIDCWQEALKGTQYEGMLNGASYTGNMRSVFTNSGLFEWKPMSFSASRGDIYLNESCHTAMCLDGSPSNDILGEFSLAENGTIYGKSGDQTGYESYVHWYYDYPWDGILHYIGNDANITQEVHNEPEPQNTSSEEQPIYNVNCGNWCGPMSGKIDLGGSSDDFGGNYGRAAQYISIGNVGKYRVASEQSGILDWVDKYDPQDLVYGAAGDGSPITKLWIPAEDVHYQVHIKEGEWLPEMIGSRDSGGSLDDYAGNGLPIDCFRIWK